MIKWGIVFILCLAAVCFALTFVKSNDEEEVIQSNDRNINVLQVEIVTEYINIRKSKSVDSEIIGKVYKSEVYTVLSEDDDSSYKWIEIMTNTNLHGYISGKDDYVKRLQVSSNKEGEKEESSETTDTSKTETKKDTEKNTETKTETKTDTTVETKACTRTCSDGYTLKNPDSASCYCEEEMTPEKAKLKLIKVLQSVGYTCTTNKCILYKDVVNDDNSTYSYSFYFDFDTEEFNVLFLYEEAYGGMDVVYKYGKNTATSKYVDATGVYNTTCSYIYPFIQCDSDTNKAREFLNTSIKLFKEYLKTAGISVHDLSKEF